MTELILKIGGAAGVEMAHICDEIAELWAEGRRLVLLHGGSDATNRLAEALGHEQRFVTSASGHVSRLTDRRTLEIFMMATAQLNRALVEALLARGVPALGLSGLDGRIVSARRKPAIRIVEDGRQRVVRDDWTGTPTGANADLLRALLDAGHLPVIAPLAAGEGGEALNVDGDRAAAAVAGALGAQTLLILSNVPGLLRRPPDESTLIPALSAAELEDATHTIAAGRMRKKLLGASEALGAGVASVIIADGRIERPIAAALAGGGTRLQPSPGAPRHPLPVLQGEGLTKPLSTRLVERGWGEGKPLSRGSGEGMGERGSLAAERRHGSGAYGLRDIALVRGAGARVWDDEGREYIDCTAGYGVASLGHGHPALTATIAAQAEALITCHSVFANDRRAELLGLLAELLPAGLARIFLCNSGAEAVEAALKLARLSTGRPGIVAAAGGFHGRTLGALSATWEPRYREPFAPLLDGVRHIPLNDRAALDAALTSDVGALILEVVQGEGGVRPADGDFLRAAQALCQARGALLIIDEVQTGVGRTGRTFAIEHHGLEPDILCLAKGLGGGVPIGAVAFGPRVKQLGVGMHGSTFGGNPLACAAACAVLRALHDERLPEQAAELGAWLLDELRALPSRQIRAVRGLGLLVGIELRGRAVPVLQALQARGVLALSAGPNVVRLLPPLTVGRDELAQVIAVLREVLQ